jgi:hypothetical protein
VVSLVIMGMIRGGGQVPVMNILVCLAKLEHQLQHGNNMQNGAQV